jgi:hypothetical protein
MASVPNNNLEQVLQDQIAKPASASGDGQSVTMRSASEMIAADKYIQQQNARRAAGGDAWAMVGKKRIRKGGHT